MYKNEHVFFGDKKRDQNEYELNGAERNLAKVKDCKVAANVLLPGLLLEKPRFHVVNFNWCRVFTPFVTDQLDEPNECKQKDVEQTHDVVDEFAH